MQSDISNAAFFNGTGESERDPITQFIVRMVPFKLSKFITVWEHVELSHLPTVG